MYSNHTYELAFKFVGRIAIYSNLDSPFYKLIQISHYYHFHKLFYQFPTWLTTSSSFIISTLQMEYHLFNRPIFYILTRNSLTLNL